VPERIVVSFRGFVPLRGDGAKSYLDRALLLKQQAEAFGANLCAWGSRTFSFDFGADELEEAISLALLAESERGVARRARFGVGIAQGEMRVVSEGGSLAVLSWGAGLVRSVALARIAGAGEVLVDPRLPAARRGELLSLGARLGLDPGGTVRGLPLDLETPWRRDAAEAVTRLVEPPERVGSVSAAHLEVPVGSLGLVRAPAGLGGTRLLTDWLDRLRPTLAASGGRALLVRPVWTHAPGASLEPFGALRVAIGESLVAEGEVLLSPELSSVADDLLAGRGGTPRAVAALLDAVVTGGGESGALAIDCVTRVDAASLRAIAQAMVERGAFRAVCRLDGQELLPRALAPVTLGPAWSLAPLSPSEGARLAVGFSGGALDARVAARWARRGEGAPLAIREALAASIVTGELVWRATGLLPQRRSAGRGAPASASKWILRRLARAQVDEREVLAALAVLGRDALPEELGAIVERATGRAVPAPAIIDELYSKKWLVRWPSGRVQLAADSCRDTLLKALSGPERRRRQAAAAEVVARAAGPCELADATWLALEGGDVERALGWAEVAVIHMAALGLPKEAERLAQLFEPHGAPSACCRRSRWLRRARLRPSRSRRTITSRIRSRRPRASIRAAVGSCSPSPPTPTSTPPRCPLRRTSSSRHSSQKPRVTLFVAETSRVWTARSQRSRAPAATGTGSP
jgi:hypothetical protein